MKKYIYLDDVRTPKDSKWEIVRNAKEFREAIQDIGLENIALISLDHDLGETAIKEFFRNAARNKTINYDNILEETGMDCAKWIVDHYLDNYDGSGTNLPEILVHSANPVGAKNIMSYINNFLKSRGLEETCYRVQIPHTS